MKKLELPPLKQKVEALKFQKKTTYSKLAAQIGLTEAALLRILDRNDCKVKTLFELAHALEVSIIELVLTDQQLEILTKSQESNNSGQSQSIVMELYYAKEKIQLLEQLIESKDQLLQEIKK